MSASLTRMIWLEWLSKIYYLRIVIQQVAVKHDGNYHERWALLGWKLLSKNYYRKIIIQAQRVIFGASLAGAVLKAGWALS